MLPLLGLMKYGIVLFGSRFGRLEEAERFYLDKRLEEGGDTRMKFDKLLKHDILTGIVLGALIGLYYPEHIGAFKPLLVIVGVVMGLKVVATK